MVLESTTPFLAPGKRAWSEAKAFWTKLEYQNWPQTCGYINRKTDMQALIRICIHRLLMVVPSFHKQGLGIKPVNIPVDTCVLSSGAEQSSDHRP